MKTIIDKNLGALVHVYDYLNGGYFVAHHQLQYYDEKAYELYINDDKNNLIRLYNQLKANVPDSILSIIEKSAGIRYFCCDGCHDAKIKNAYMDDCYLVIVLDTDGMQGCLDVDESCLIKIKTDTELSCQALINDIQIFKGLFWLSSDLFFNDNIINLELELQAFSDSSYENIKYEFVITDIEIE